MTGQRTRPRLTLVVEGAAVSCFDQVAPDVASTVVHSISRSPTNRRIPPCACRRPRSTTPGVVSGRRSRRSPHVYPLVVGNDRRLRSW